MQTFAVLAKLAYFVPVALVFAMARTDAPTLFFASVDLLLGLLFFTAWRRIASRRLKPDGGAAAVAP
jgi:hypothetical protein